MQTAKYHCKRPYIHKPDNLDKWTTYLKDTIKLTQDKMKNLLCLFLLKGLNQNSVHFNKDIISLDLKKITH